MPIQGGPAFQMQEPVLLLQFQGASIKLQQRGPKVHPVLFYPVWVIGQAAHQVQFRTNSRIIPAILVVTDAAAQLKSLSVPVTDPVLQISA